MIKYYRSHLLQGPEKSIDIYILPQSLTARPSEIVVGIRSFPFGFRPIFSGEHVKLQGCIPQNALNSGYSGLGITYNKLAQIYIHVYIYIYNPPSNNLNTSQLSQAIAGLVR